MLYPKDRESKHEDSTNQIYSRHRPLISRGVAAPPAPTAAMARAGGTRFAAEPAGGMSPAKYQMENPVAGRTLAVVWETRSDDRNRRRCCAGAKAVTHMDEGKEFRHPDSIARIVSTPSK